MCLSFDAPKPVKSPAPPPAPERTSQEVSPSSKAPDKVKGARLGLESLRVPLDAATTLSV